MKVSTFIANLNLNKEFYKQCTIKWLREEMKHRGLKSFYNKRMLIEYLLMYDNSFHYKKSNTILCIRYDFDNKCNIIEITNLHEITNYTYMKVLDKHELEDYIKRWMRKQKKKMKIEIAKH